MLALVNSVKLKTVQEPLKTKNGLNIRD